jgi:CheY-like chemotaxis protein
MMVRCGAGFFDFWQGGDSAPRRPWWSSARTVTLPARKDRHAARHAARARTSAALKACIICIRVHYQMQRPVVMDTNNGTPRKRHVLIVDDDIQLAWSLKETLENDGYEATIVPDGALALKFALGHHLDAVVCDLQMLGVEGDLLYATVERSNPSLARRFIFITGLDDHPQFQKFIDTIELPALHKPVALAALRGEVVRVAERR